MTTSKTELKKIKYKKYQSAFNGYKQCSAQQQSVFPFIIGHGNLGKRVGTLNNDRFHCFE